MTISYHISTFYQRTIKEYESGKLLESPQTTAYKIGISWDDTEAGKSIIDLAKELLADPQARNLSALIIGNWGDCYENSPQDLIDLLVDHAQDLPQLKAIFFGDIVMEECEISWIIQGDYKSFFKAFPNLEHFQVRGSSDLTLGLEQHANLKTLIVECGGLPNQIMHNVSAAQLPQLTHLELWLGSDNYGCSVTQKDIEKLLTSPFPKLEYLGLRDSEEADMVAKVVATAALLKQIKILDLSLGNISDAGGMALLNSPFIALIDKLDLHHHYISDDIQNKLKGLGIAVDLTDPQEADEDGEDVYRYIAVSE